MMAGNFTEEVTHRVNVQSVRPCARGSVLECMVEEKPGGTS